MNLLVFKKYRLLVFTVFLLIVFMNYHFYSPVVVSKPFNSTQPYSHNKRKSLTEADRDCFREEWKTNFHITETADFGSSYRISFSDIQKEFNWIYLPNISPCEILMIVASRTDNFARRNVLRKTWMSGNNSQIVGNGRMKSVFLVGLNSGEPNTKKLVLEEARLYGDMIVADLEDNYAGLTYKSISLFLYAISKSSNSKLIGKIDEDVLFFPDQLTRYLEDGTIDLDSSSLYGDMFYGAPIHHDEKNQWYVPQSSTKCLVFPDYPFGPFYLITSLAARKIVQSTKHRNFLGIEDALIGGILADDVAVSKVNLPMLHMLRGTFSGDEPFLAWHNVKNDGQYLEYFNEFLEKNH